MIVVVMGPCGCGKTTVGGAVATRIRGHFIEGDEFHPPENKAKMEAGTPLNDDDRAPWLDAIAKEARARSSAETPIVIACSALKRIYRDRLRKAGGGVTFVLLTGTDQLLRTRMEAREDHFMPPSLLDSQLEALEPPGEDENAIIIDITPGPEALADGIVKKLGL